MRRTKEEAEKTRQDLLNAALRIFSLKGFNGTRLADIAAAAEVTRGAIYHHFGSKKELLVALMDNASEKGNQAVGAAVQEGGTFLQIVERILIYTLTLVEEDARFRQVMALSLSTESVEVLDQRRRESAIGTVMGISEPFAAAKAQGQLRPDVDPITAARAFIAFQNGLIMLWLANRDAFSLKATAVEFATIYLNGIAQ